MNYRKDKQWHIYKIEQYSGIKKDSTNNIYNKKHTTQKPCGK